MTGDQTICPGTAVIYVSPLGFHQYASDFASCAARLKETGSSRYSPVPYYLICRSIELSLKAFLLARGLSKRVLKERSYGHDLTSLLRKAKELRLHDFVALPSEWEDEVRKASEHYSRKNFEYFSLEMVFARSLPSLPLLEATADRLLADLKQVCVDAVDRPPPS